MFLKVDSFDTGTSQRSCCKSKQHGQELLIEPKLKAAVTLRLKEETQRSFKKTVNRVLVR